MSDPWQCPVESRGCKSKYAAPWGSVKVPALGWEHPATLAVSKHSCLCPVVGGSLQGIHPYSLRNLMGTAVQIKHQGKGQLTSNISFRWRGGHIVVGGMQRWILNWCDMGCRREEDLSILINPEGFRRWRGRGWGLGSFENGLQALDAGVDTYTRS